MKYNREINFGSSYKSNIGCVTNYMCAIDEKINRARELKYQTAFLYGNYKVNVMEYLNHSQLNEKASSIDDISEYLSYFMNNMPNYSNPGTAINVIPPVNLFSLAATSYFSQYSANLAQDTYSGNVFLAELEVIKYISEMAHWDWKRSAGIFTFGGKGTNLYGTKIAILNADHRSFYEGVEKGKYFIVTSENGHPCHAQVCDWLGLGKDACIEIPCDYNGIIDLSIAEYEIRKNIEQGKIFLGINLNGGSTNEMAIDPIKRTRDLVDLIKNEYSLSYNPLVHVDSVLGWVYLLFDSYDFQENHMQISENVLKKIQKLYHDISEIKYADSFGVDFHKTGFCPYISSLFVIRDKHKMELLNPEKNMPDIEKMKYGDYNPYNYSLECSRTSSGPIAALTTLKFMGKEGLRTEIVNIMESVDIFRFRLKNDKRICLIEEGNSSFATLFVLCPQGHSFSQEDLYKYSESDLTIVREFNVAFGKYILQKALNRDISFVFSSSRSYTLPGTQISVGALKVWMISVFHNKEFINKFIGELFECIDSYYYQFYSNTIDKQVNGYFADPSRK